MAAGSQEWWPKLPIAELSAGYEVLPGSPHEKRRLMIVLLRCRIERVVMGLPPSVVKAPGRPNLIRTRLMASVGEPGLDAGAAMRLAVVRQTVATYEALCAVLHGDSTSLYPSTHDIAAWEGSVMAAERHFRSDGSLERAESAKGTV